MRKHFVLVVCMLVLAGGCVAPREFSRRSRTRSFDRLWRTLKHNYAFFGVQEEAKWLRDTYRDRAIHADTPGAYLRVMYAMLGDLCDGHVYIDNAWEWRRTHGDWAAPSMCELSWWGGKWWASFEEDAVIKDDQAPPLPRQAQYRLLAIDGVPVNPYTTDLIRGHPDKPVELTLLLADYTERKVHIHRGSPPGGICLPGRFCFPKFRRYHCNVFYERICDGRVGYIWLGNCERGQTLKDFDKALDDLMDTQALVIDLAENGGGRLETVTGIVGRFVDTRAPYGIGGDLHLRVNLDGFTWETVRTSLRAPSRGRTYRAPVVGIIGPNTGSGGEMLAMGFTDVLGATLVGMPTAGAHASPCEVRLPDGMVVAYSRLRAFRLDGRSHQFVGLKPDVYVPLNERAVATDGMPAVLRWYDEMIQTALDIAATRTGLDGACDEQAESANQVIQATNNAVQETKGDNHA